jgi:hypothetical protein
MSKPLSLFTHYSKKENAVTNYCGLMLKLLYQENPVFLDEFFANILKGSTDKFSIMPEFRQQEQNGSGVPDLAIRQESFEIYFENKLDDWHYSEQVRKYLTSLEDNKAQHRALLLLAKEFSDNRFSSEKDGAAKDGITLLTLTFDELVCTIENINGLSANLQDLLLQFKDMLGDKDLLNSWKYTLDVANCATTIDIIEQNEIYVCPDSGGAYHHRRAKYFGAYWNKGVEYIAELKAVVVLEKAESAEGKIKFKNTDEDDNELVKEAFRRIKESREYEELKKKDMQVFLLGRKVKADFKKETPGAMMNSKRYFMFDYKIQSLDDLQTAVNGKTWRDFGFE